MPFIVLVILLFPPYGALKCRKGLNPPIPPGGITQSTPPHITHIHPPLHIPRLIRGGRRTKQQFNNSLTEKQD